MKEIDALVLPDDRVYAESHEWAMKENGVVRVGISDYAQDQLGDIVFVEFPPVGDIFQKGAVFGTLESVKAVSEIYMPISGAVKAINISLSENPELLNKDPYAAWIIEVEPSAPSEMDQLMRKETYFNQLKGA